MAGFRVTSRGFARARGEGLSNRQSPFVRTNAKFDGTSDDSTTLNNDQRPSTSMWLPNGLAVVQASIFNIKQSKQHIRGQGMYSTTVQGAGAITSVLSSASYNSDVEISDMTLDANSLTGLSQVLLARGSLIGRLTLRRIRFVNMGNKNIISPQNVCQVIVEDCIADGQGLGLGTFMSGTSGDIELLIARRNNIRHLQQGFNMATTGKLNAHIVVENNYVDLGWWTIKAIASGSGASVSYVQGVSGGAQGTLTDTNANFGTGSGTVQVNQTVRVMTPKQTGTMTASTIGNFLADTSANFTGNGVLRGEIVRTSTAFAIVSSVESATVLHVEEWLDLNTYLPVTPPVSGTAYTVYGLLLGVVQGVANTVLTIGIASGSWGFFDLAGTRPGTIAAGTLYEILPHVVYPYQFNNGSSEIVLRDNIGKRGWGDTFSIFGSRAIVTGNLSEDSYDSGFTLQPAWGSVILGNRVRHAGSIGFGFYSGATANQGLEVGPNISEDSVWANSQATAFALSGPSGIKMTGGQSFINAGAAIGDKGLRLTSGTTGCVIRGFSGHGHATADIYIGSGVTAGANKILDPDVGTIVYQVANIGQFIRMQGTGVPAIAASIGSQFNRTDGGAATSFYVKESGTDVAGWVGK